MRFQEGCQKSLIIPVEDPDGDFVKCRWATDAESSIPNDSFSYGELDEVNFFALSMIFFLFKHKEIKNLLFTTRRAKQKLFKSSLKKPKQDDHV